jgi:hypothetical protein
VNIIQSLNLLELAKLKQYFGMDPQTSADMPSFVGWGAGQVEKGTFDVRVLDGLKELELKPEVVSSKAASITQGFWVGAQIDPVTRHMKGGVTRGLEGGVVGY